MRVNPVFSGCNNFAWSCVDKGTTGMYISVPVISNVPSHVEQVITQFADQRNIRFISHLISDISRVLQKWLKYFNGAAVSTSLLLTPGVLPFVFTLNLESVISSSGSSLQYCHKLLHVFA